MRIVLLLLLLISNSFAQERNLSAKDISDLDILYNQSEELQALVDEVSKRCIINGTIDPNKVIDDSKTPHLTCGHAQKVLAQRAKKIDELYKKIELNQQVDIQRSLSCSGTHEIDDVKSFVLDIRAVAAAEEEQCVMGMKFKNCWKDIKCNIVGGLVNNFTGANLTKLINKGLGFADDESWFGGVKQKFTGFMAKQMEFTNSITTALGCPNQAEKSDCFTQLALGVVNAIVSNIKFIIDVVLAVVDTPKWIMKAWNWIFEEDAKETTNLLHISNLDEELTEVKDEHLRELKRAVKDEFGLDMDGSRLSPSVAQKIKEKTGISMVYDDEGNIRAFVDSNLGLDTNKSVGENLQAARVTAEEKGKSMVGKFFDSLISGAMDHIKNNYACQKFDPNDPSRCLVPLTGCADCNTLINGLCGIGGLLIGEIVSTYVLSLATGGAAAALKLGRHGAKGASYAIRGSSRMAKVVKVVNKSTYQIRKVLTYVGQKLTKNSLYHGGRKIVRNLMSNEKLLKGVLNAKATAKYVVDETVHVAKKVTKPARKYVAKKTTKVRAVATKTYDDFLSVKARVEKSAVVTKTKDATKYVKESKVGQAVGTVVELPKKYVKALDDAGKAGFNTAMDPTKKFLARSSIATKSAVTSPIITKIDDLSRAIDDAIPGSKAYHELLEKQADEVQKLFNIEKVDYDQIYNGMYRIKPNGQSALNKYVKAKLDSITDEDILRSFEETFRRFGFQDPVHNKKLVELIRENYLDSLTFHPEMGKGTFSRGAVFRDKNKKEAFLASVERYLRDNDPANVGSRISALRANIDYSVQDLIQHIELDLNDVKDLFAATDSYAMIAGKNDAIDIANNSRDLVLEQSDTRIANYRFPEGDMRRQQGMTFDQHFTDLQTESLTVIPQVNGVSVPIDAADKIVSHYTKQTTDIVRIKLGIEPSLFAGPSTSETLKITREMLESAPNSQFVDNLTEMLNRSGKDHIIYNPQLDIDYLPSTFRAPASVSSDASALVIKSDDFLNIGFKDYSELGLITRFDEADLVRVQAVDSQMKLATSKSNKSMSVLERNSNQFEAGILSERYKNSIVEKVLKDSASGDSKSVLSALGDEASGWLAKDRGVQFEKFKMGNLEGIRIKPIIDGSDEALNSPLNILAQQFKTKTGKDLVFFPQAQNFAKIDEIIEKGFISQSKYAEIFKEQTGVALEEFQKVHSLSKTDLFNYITPEKHLGDIRDIGYGIDSYAGRAKEIIDGTREKARRALAYDNIGEEEVRSGLLGAESGVGPIQGEDVGKAIVIINPLTGLPYEDSDAYDLGFADPLDMLNLNQQQHPY